MMSYLKFWINFSFHHLTVGRIKMIISQVVIYSVCKQVNTKKKCDTFQECSDFRAGDVIRSKFKSAKLDVTGLFGSICIHDYPQYFIDMKKGER